MIIVRIFQGPGNQMFQYAFGLANALRLKTELKLDLAWYNDYSYHRQYILDKFRINAVEASKEEIYDVKKCNGPNFIAYRWNQLNRLYLSPYYQRPMVEENMEIYDPNLKKLADNTYVNGYFTSRDFFIDYIDQVRKHFQFVKDPSDQNKRMADKIRSENAVAISFRLGDFINHPWQNVTSIQYYYRCIDYLQQRFSNLKFYVFSDDIGWVKQHFKIEHPVQYMDYNAPDYMEDFRMLTYFKLHIIPNSTFSWWGALLAEDKNKIVLCPEHWLSPDKSTYKSDWGNKVVHYDHVLPKEWVRIPNIVAGDNYISL